MQVGHPVSQLILGVLCASLLGCGSPKPPSDQIFLMPAPDLYTEGRVDPFSDNAQITRASQPKVLFATDRTPSADKARFAFYGDGRDNVLHLGEARIQLGANTPITWEEARRISLLKSRTGKYPLKITTIEEYGVLERTVPPIRTDVARNTAPGRQFAEAINAR